MFLRRENFLSKDTQVQNYRNGLDGPRGPLDWKFGAFCPPAKLNWLTRVPLYTRQWCLSDGGSRRRWHDRDVAPKFLAHTGHTPDCVQYVLYIYIRSMVGHHCNPERTIEIGRYKKKRIKIEEKRSVVINISEENGASRFSFFFSNLKGNVKPFPWLLLLFRICEMLTFPHLCSTCRDWCAGVLLTWHRESYIAGGVLIAASYDDDTQHLKK